MYLVHVLIHRQTIDTKKHFRFWLGEQGYLRVHPIGLGRSVVSFTNRAPTVKNCTYIHAKEYLCT